MASFSGSGTPLTSRGLEAFLTATGADQPDLWSVLSVETSGCGFLPDKRPKILFERHKFHALTGGKYDQSHPDISQPSAGGYGAAGANQYNRLNEAISLDPDSALKSASWGIGQIMGLNFQAAGFSDVQTMVDAMVDAEDNQLAAMASFLISNHLDGPLARQDWTNFALGYNGPNYAQNNYDGLLGQFHARFSAGPLPDLQVRMAQVLLTYKGFDPKGIDGLMGGGTKAAITQFQTQVGLPATGQIDQALLDALAG
jgi:hypothetical protein